MFLDDTIAAISTAPGEGGIGIVRMSGSDSLNILSKVFKLKSGKAFENFESHTVKYGYIYDPETNEQVDEAIVIYMKGPKTYTREDVVEINCHGGVVSVRNVLETVLKSGARMSEAGEFTKRAFLNGRIDLSQAEAVIDLIRSKTDESAKIALEQSQGKTSKKVKEVSAKLLDALAHIEAAVAFPEDDIEDVISDKVKVAISEVISDVNTLINNSNAGKIYREGLNTIIVGKPNVGKSSLLNTLLQEKRAIVTDIPGTTRDVIEEYVNIKGIPVKLVDTAGIRETEDVVEKIGVEKSKEYIEKSDLVILMLDNSRALEEEDKEIIEFVNGKKVIVIINKMDLKGELDLGYIKERFNDTSIVYTSVNTEEGIEEVKDKIANLVNSGSISISDVYITNVRHRDVLLKAKESLEAGYNTLNMSMPLDMASVELKDAYLKLGEITGEAYSEDILDKIFSDFCIGK
ncbi:tRNA uridine-5-carboxymethylaminomethyl(34) synthesis GTPase MnmE [Clostridium cylindrosporum]|uniref:tRNA modification GTPase MnmE n=1 Tax=Clostridium cylindrosporum DSM 605 TaxID=1121307 RepID=A0A0J8DBR2_CLOCY|nr:tRNA uridine-5-carboxymethylaminomethyl(34) synthesis GTPase MnmE [Clostridium cylindrosporum]KMT21749.1 tRNA modification GTPase MnmE [Clostridium cylindrosporum DSM 605]